MKPVAELSFIELVEEYQKFCKCSLSNPCRRCAAASTLLQSHRADNELLQLLKGAEHNEGLVMADLEMAQSRINSLESAINKHVATSLTIREQAKGWTDAQGDGRELDKIFEDSLAELDHCANAWG